MDNNEGIITLEGDNGELVDMQVIEMLEFNGRKYVLLQSTDNKDENSYVFRFTEDIDFDRLESIDDEIELADVFGEFEKKISDSGPVH